MASALVIPCHIRTRWDLKCLLRLLDSVRDQSTLFSRVYVVDDASPLKYSLAAHDLEHVALGTNGGPARARNVAVAKALGEGHEFVFFTDHDCILDRDWHGHMARFLSDTEYAAVGGMTYSWGSTLLDRYHEVNGTLAGKWLLPDRRELWYMPSLNFGMKAYAAQEFPFDERFPHAAGEDVDLCLRLRSKYRIGFCPAAKLWHDFGYSSTLTGFWRFIRLFMKYKSSSATLYEGHTVLMWDASESIFEGNKHEPGLRLEDEGTWHRSSGTRLSRGDQALRPESGEPAPVGAAGHAQVHRVVHLPVVQDAPPSLLRCEGQ
ncbi:MAG: glycosyltransferase [Phycisphaerales bacterium]|nr:glycosyltransferase [Phycisphaerales bacterium]